jgi:hypothetical protein
MLNNVKVLELLESGAGESLKRYVMDDMTLTASKKKFKFDYITNLKRIIKQIDDQLGIKGITIYKEESTIFCNGYYLIKINEVIPATTDVPYCEGLKGDGYTALLKRDKLDEELKTQFIDKTKIDIAVKIAKMESKKYKKDSKEYNKCFFYKIGENITVNIIYLKEITSVLGNITMLHEDNAIGPMHYNSKTGEGVLLPIRTA